METTGNFAAPSPKKTRRPRGEWLKEVRSLRDSGLSPEEYATKKGLVLSTLKYWKKVLRSDVEARTKSAVPAFLPVSVLHAARTPSSEIAVMVDRGVPLIQAKLGAPEREALWKALGRGK
jgi:hypothetical protein